MKHLNQYELEQVSGGHVSDLGRIGWWEAMRRYQQGMVRVLKLKRLRLESETCGCNEK